MQDEAESIRTTLLAELPKTWDGKSCIEQMRTGGSGHWRQMEWIGWYFEWRAYAILTSRLGGGTGPRYETTAFDYRNTHIWDFKSHVNNACKPWAILNDAAAVEKCIVEHRELGFVVANGPAFYNDAARSFKTWHDQLKGDPSDYVMQGQNEGRPSRRRKTVFHFAELVMF